MDAFQIVGLLMAITAFVLFLTLIITSTRRKNNPSFLPLFASIAFVLLGVFLMAMPAIASTNLELVATWINTPAHSIVYINGKGLIRATINSGNLFLDQNAIAFKNFDSFSGIIGLAATFNTLYIAEYQDLNGAVHKYDLLSATIKQTIGLTHNPYDLAVGFLNSTTDAVFINIQGNITFNGRRILSHVLSDAHAITVHDHNLYISDQTRVVVYNYERDTVVRIIGPLPMARRMALFTNNKQQTYLVMVPLNPGSSVQLFDLDGGLFTSIKGLTKEVATSSGQLFLSDGLSTIRIFE